MTLRAAVTFENFQAHPYFRVFFYLAPFKKHKNSCVYHNLICWRYLITGTTGSEINFLIRAPTGDQV